MPDKAIAIDENISSENISLSEQGKLEFFIEEKKQAENTIVFIVKLYAYVFGFLFVYSGFISKEFLQSTVSTIDTISSSVPFDIDDTSFIKKSISGLGMILIIAIVIFGKYGTVGIAHAIKKRLKYKYAINKIVNKDNLLDGIEIEHFLKIPVIYTLTTSIIVLGSIYYLLIAFGYSNNIAITLIMSISIISLRIFPRTNIIFYNTLHNYIKEIYIENNKEYTCKKCINRSDKSTTILTIFSIILIILFICIDIQVHQDKFDLETRNFVYIEIISSLAFLEYIYIHIKMGRQTFIERLFKKIIK